MRYLPVILLLCFFSKKISAQTIDSSHLKALYDRCLDFSESKLDSLYYYADFIAQNSHRLNFKKGDVLSLRLKGIYFDLKGDYEVAIDYYLQSLTAAQKIGGTEYEIAAYTDLAILYCHIKQPHKAKEMYLQSASLLARQGNLGSLLTAYANLGAIYNQLKLPDSALFFLQKGLDIGQPFKNTMDLSVIYNNMGNVYFSKKEYGKALEFFNINKQQSVHDSSLASMWIDYLNIGDVFIEMKRYDSAQWYGSRSLAIAKQLNSRSKESDSYALMSKLYARKGEYKTAYELQKGWYSLDTSLVNDETNTTIADLQEKYNSQKRQRENDVLVLELDKEKLYKKATAYLLGAALIIVLLIAISLIQNRRANKKLQSVNQLIVRQNEKLTELNFEKNSLISIVSHDLGLPFASIKMWGQLLAGEDGSLNAGQQKALTRIIDSTTKGEELIKNILDVERAEVNQHPVCLENFDLGFLLDNITDDFRPSAWKKDICITCQVPAVPLFIISDRQLVSRICQNLVSNAIKFTPKGKKVAIGLMEEKENVTITIADEGIGIHAEELPALFSKYSKITSRPTDGESSNGLGLSIVKRIVQELNGSIFCKSEPGVGTLFTVVLKK